MVAIEAILRSSLRDRYRIDREIGRGGMSVVYRADDLKHNRTVAIKLLRPELSERIGAERFHREIEIVAGLTHPHILPLYDSGEVDGLLYYVMPYVDGGSLRLRIQRDGPLPEAEALRITREIADALGFAHKHGVIHRDVKPGNILLSADHALLADFGIAHHELGVLETLTQAGLALGTPAYLSPEQAVGEAEIDGRSDLYSLGCVLYEALTGVPPFAGDSVRAMLVHQVLDTPTSVRSLNVGVSTGAEAIVETALRKDPDERFQSGAQMAEASDLVAHAGGLPIRALRRLGLRRRHLDRARPFVAAVALLLAFASLFTLRGWLAHDDRAGRAEVRYVVLEHEAMDATDWERELTRTATRTLRDQLSGWATVSVVRGPALEGPIVEYRAAGLAQGTLALGTSLADRFDADYRLYVAAAEPTPLTPGALASAERTVTVTAWVYHPRDQVQLAEHSHTGPASDLAALTAEIAMELLDVEGDPYQYSTLIARSPDHRAHQEFQAGREAMYAWRLEEAERLLRAAIARDTAFALAHHVLAETMYWQMARDEERMRELGPRVESHSRRADRLGVADRLRPGERKAVDAFRAFWTGDYDLARSRYDSLLAFEPYDFESMVLRGAVEVEDPIAFADEDGQLHPRQNLNVAWAMFDTATALNPYWELSWGHLHRIDRMLRETSTLGWCFGFEPPSEELVPPYAIREAVEQVFFCPVVEADSIGWTSSDIVDRTGTPESRAAAEALHRRTKELLDKWTLMEEDQPRHHEELADFLLWEQYVPGCSADTVHTDSLRAEARMHAERALAIRGDTIPQHRLALAAHYLGAGQLDRALTDSDRALAELEGWESTEGTPLPPFAANVYLAAGRVHPAIDILERVWGENTATLLDPGDESRSLDTRGMYSTLITLMTLGALGESGPAVTQRFDRLRRAWQDTTVPERDRVALRAASLRYVESALLHSPEMWDEWFADWDRYGLDLPAIWQGILAAWSSPGDMEEARARLDEALGDLAVEEEVEGPLRPIDFYLPLQLARKSDAPAVEADLRDRVSRCALGLSDFDPGWGVKRYVDALP